MNTKNVYLPLSDLYDVVFEMGEYDISSKIKILPGCNVTVKKGAKLDINADVIIYSDFVDTASIGPLYPTSEQLGQVGANLYVNGTLNINSGISFGGVIKANGENGIININSGAILSASSKEGIGVRTGSGISTSLSFKPNVNIPITEMTKVYFYEKGNISKD